MTGFLYSVEKYIQKFTYLPAVFCDTFATKNKAAAYTLKMI